MNSHLISQVVLKQFANKEREILVHTKGSDEVSAKPIKDVASREIDKDVIGHLEMKWGTGVETAADKAINGLASKGLNSTQKHINTVKQLMALHFVRAQIFYLVEVTRKEFDETIDKIRDDFIKARPDMATEISKLVQEQHDTAAHDVAVKVMEEFIPLIEEYISDPQIKLEVGEAPEGEQFIIGDNPAITVDANRNWNVPIKEATSFAMPLTPRYVVSLKKNPKTNAYLKMTNEQVRNFNSIQIAQMYKEYYSYPASEAE